MPSKNYDVDFKKTIVDLYQNGKGATELSREYGLSKQIFISGFLCMHKLRRQLVKLQVTMRS